MLYRWVDVFLEFEQVTRGLAESVCVLQHYFWLFSIQIGRKFGIWESLNLQQLVSCLHLHNTQPFVSLDDNKLFWNPDFAYGDRDYVCWPVQDWNKGKFLCKKKWTAALYAAAKDGGLQQIYYLFIRGIKAKF